MYPTPTPLRRRRTRRQDQTGGHDSGQATTEYALVLLGAATIALVLIGWAGGGRIGSLLNHVLDSVTSGLH